MPLFHDVSNLLVVADLCEICSMVNCVQRTHYLEPTGIIINIDTISNINLKAGMCHMEFDWFITYRI